MLARELLFEKVRCEKFPHKPSRFECVFTCQILSDFDIFIDKYNRTSGYRYEVELIDPSLPSHVGDYTLCHWQHGVTYKDLKDVANKYWSGVDIVGREFLTMSALKVVKVL